MMDAEKAAQLRAPFPPSAIGKLPKPYRADSQKGNCKECGGYHGLPAVHLDYVGHAAATDRLLQVDPGWTWEPFAVDDRGLPALDAKGNLWIRLTVAGVTRIGVGDGKSMKECIGDAIRNASMRFGVALDLWAKEDLHEGRTPVPVASEMPPAERAPAPEPTPADKARAELLDWAAEQNPKVHPSDLNATHIAAHGRGLGDEEDPALIRAYMMEAEAA